jgi:endonuclease/exonuclease/phosphatase family metal-dependent hydrolase
MLHSLARIPPSHQKKHRLRHFLVWATLIAGLLVYLPSLLVYWVSPADWWVMGVLAVGFSFTWFGFLAVVVAGFWIGKKTGIGFLALWLLGIPMMVNTIGLRQPKPWQMKKNPLAIRVMQWNCMELAGGLKSDSSAAIRRQIRHMIKAYDPDIITMQDLQDQQNPWVHSNFSFIRDTLGYRYASFAPYVYRKHAWGSVAQGSAIFSKMPLVRQGKIAATHRPYPEYILWGDVVWRQQPLRIVSTHFESMNLNTPAFENATLFPHQVADSGIVNSGNVWKKLRFYPPLHVQHAWVLRRLIDSTKVPIILGLDMNTLPTGYVYKATKGNLQDVWLQTGFGWGSTYYKRLPHLRIDYLLASPGWQVNQCTIVRVKYSDHYPLVADLQWK